MYLIFKRLIDVLASLVILLFLFPFLILVVFLIKIDSKGPIFYLQSRVGKNGHLFKVNAARKSKVDDNTARMQSIKQLGV